MFNKKYYKKYYKKNRKRIIKQTQQWKRDNPEKEKAYRKKRYKKNRKKQIAYAKKWRKDNRARYLIGKKKQNKLARIKRPERYLFERTKSRAKEYNLEFNLTLSDIVIPKNCPILGIPLFFTDQSDKSNRNPNSPSIDRIDSTKGYTPDNIVIVSWRANHLKNNGTLEEMTKIVKWLKRIQRGSIM